MLGPGKVVFQDGKVVFVRHAPVFVRVCPNRLCKVDHGNTDDENIFRGGEEGIQMGLNKSSNCSNSASNNYNNSSVLSENISGKSEANQNTNDSNILLHDQIEYKLPNSLEWTKQLQYFTTCRKSKW